MVTHVETPVNDVVALHGVNDVLAFESWALAANLPFSRTVPGLTTVRKQTEFCAQTAVVLMPGRG